MASSSLRSIRHARYQHVFGIIISLYFYDNERHSLPHIHAKYQAWIEIRREDLLADWELAIKGQSLFPIDPLR